MCQITKYSPNLLRRKCQHLSKFKAVELKDSVDLRASEKLMKIRSQFLLFIVLILSFTFSAQVTVSGRINDEKGLPIPGALIRVLKQDSSLLTGQSSNAEGTFSLSLPTHSTFILHISYSGYGGPGSYLSLATKQESIQLKPIVLKESAKNLRQVDVTVVQQRGVQKGDTTQFNANAYKTNPDATAEDLIKKLPGVTSDNNGVKVNGEAVQKVLVDGKPFFGDDPTATIKNLPADMIDKIEVFDKMSDQAAFSGFNTGDQQKTINFVTKKNKMVGQFGRIYAGAGVDENSELRYLGGAAVNNFNGPQRISLLLLSNNVNQQNFSMADLSGAMGSGGNRGMGGRNSTTLMNQSQNGIATTQAVGLNYSDEWGKKVTASGSYFFNSTENLASGNLNRTFFTDNQLTYLQSNQDRNFNINHRGNLRIEYAIDSANKLIYTPAFTFQDNTAKSLLIGQNQIRDNILLSSTNTDSRSNTRAYDLTNNLLWQHRFKKKGRSFSANLSSQINNRDNFGRYYSANRYSDTSAFLLDQNFQTESYTRKTSGNFSFTEQLSTVSQLEITYTPGYTESASDRQTRDFDILQNDYTRFNTTLSNKYNNYYSTQRAGLNYRYNKNKVTFTVGSDGQLAELNGIQFYPYTARVKQRFNNLLPSGTFNYKFDKTRNLRIFYRSSTNIPSITQLQNVLDISNPLQIKTGNDSLRQTFDNSLNVRYGGFNTGTSKNLMLFANFSTSANYISNATYILQRDSLLQGYRANAGTQLTRPVNLKGYYNGRMFITYGQPFKKIKSNINFNAGINYGHTPSLINDLLNYSQSYASNAGFNISSNISERLDFSLGLNGNYTIVKNTQQSRSDNQFYSQTASFRVNWLFLKGFVFNSDISHTLYRGLSQNFNQSFFLWNAYLGYKLLKNKSLEARLFVYDLLNQNRSISRTVTGAYTEDNYTSVLRRYAMFSLTYTFKKFKSGDAPKIDPLEGPKHPGMTPGGGFRHMREGGF